MNLPALQGNWVDLVIVVVLFLYTLEGYEKGFIRGSIEAIGFIVSLLFSLRFYPFAAHILIANFSLPHGIAKALGFFIMAVALDALLSFAFSYLAYYIKPHILPPRVNRALGVIPSCISVLVLISFTLITLVTLPIRPDMKHAIVKSKIGGFLTGKTLYMERTISSIFGEAVEESLTFLTVKPHGDEVVNLHFNTLEFVADETSEKEMALLLNRERSARGITSLEQDVLLRSVARTHCEDMMRRGYFSHNTPEGVSPFERMDKAGVRYSVAGENLAYAPTVEIAHNGLMNSPGHRANILSAEFGKVGIGIINGGIYGRMFCQEFTN